MKTFIISTILEAPTGDTQVVLSIRFWSVSLDHTTYCNQDEVSIPEPYISNSIYVLEQVREIKSGIYVSIVQLLYRAFPSIKVHK